MHSQNDLFIHKHEYVTSSETQSRTRFSIEAACNFQSPSLSSLFLYPSLESKVSSRLRSEI